MVTSNFEAGLGILRGSTSSFFANMSFGMIDRNHESSVNMNNAVESATNGELVFRFCYRLNGALEVGGMPRAVWPTVDNFR